MKSSMLAIYLQRALDLAASGLEKKTDGPLLGWVMTKDGLIIEEGESMAHLLSTFNHSDTFALWRDSTLFLSINPLADADALASFCANRGIGAYYVATNPESPVRQLALDLNRRYLTWLEKKRPYIILKWAETADGFIARSNYQPYWISSLHARKLVHQWRSQEAAIWVGKNTYLHDNPRLNVRDWEGINPIRMVVDLKLSLDAQLHIFDQCQPTLCYNKIKDETQENLEYVQFPSNASWKDRVQIVLDDLHQRHIQSVFVEGGGVLLTFLLENGWWDEARVFQSATTFGEGVKAPKIAHFYPNPVVRQRVSDDTLTIYRRVTPSHLKAE